MSEKSSKDKVAARPDPFPERERRRLNNLVNELRRSIWSQGISLTKYLLVPDQLIYVYSETIRVDELRGIRVPVTMSVAGRAVREKRPILVDDASRERAFYDEIDRMTRFHTGSVVACPVSTAEGVLGVLEAVRETGRPAFSRDEFARVKQITVEFEDNVQHRDAKDVWNLCSTAFAQIHRDTPCEGASFLVWSEAHQLLEFFASETIEYGRLDGWRLPRGAGIIWKAAIENTTLRIDDPYEQTEFVSMVDEAFRFKTGAMMCVPLHVRGDLVGVVQVVRRAGYQPFERDDEAILTSFAPEFAEILGSADVSVFPDDME